jgi:hypothetical protein
MWTVKTKVIPVIIRRDWDHFKVIRKTREQHTRKQRSSGNTAILGTAHIHRKVLTYTYNGVNAGTSDMSTINSNTRIQVYDISSLRSNDLTLILLTCRKWWAPNNASKQQMGFNPAFKGLMLLYCRSNCRISESDYTSAMYQISGMSTGTSNSQDVRYG